MDPVTVQPPLRIARPTTAGLPEPSVPFDQQLDSLQREITVLRDELNLRRRRDETLNFYMQRLDEEMRLAARLQQDFLPKSLPQVGPLHFHTLFRPAGYVSGDLYDVTRLDEEHIGFSIIDAVGHGMPAALLTMFIKRALVTKEIIPGGYRLLQPAEAMAQVNEALIDQNLSQATFATALYGIVNTSTLTVTFARGGHPSPILLTREGAMEEINAEGGLLGIFPGETFSEGSVQLSTGDRLFIYSDGLEIAFAKDQTMDMRQWRAELYARRHLSMEQLLTDFSDHLDQEDGSLAPKDDLTIIVLEVK